MNHLINNSSQLFQVFTNEGIARLYLESRLWPKGYTCPICFSQDRITPRKGGFYRCNKCQLDFTIRTGTIFERSHIPLHKWIYAIYLITHTNISSMQLAKEIDVQQKSAWFMIHRLRKAYGERLSKLQFVTDNNGDDSMDKTDPTKFPEVLDEIIDVVIAYHPLDKQKTPHQRKKLIKKEGTKKGAQNLIP